MPSGARSKYNAVKVTIDGVTFDSKAEARRYVELKLLEKAGQIIGLVLQPAFTIFVAGVEICEYRADFSYRPIGWTRGVVEDVKGMKTAVYRLKKKMVEAQYGITITEIR